MRVANQHKEESWDDASSRLVATSAHLRQQVVFNLIKLKLRLTSFVPFSRQDAITRSRSSGGLRWSLSSMICNTLLFKGKELSTLTQVKYTTKHFQSVVQGRWHMQAVTWCKRTLKPFISKPNFDISGNLHEVLAYRYEPRLIFMVKSIRFSNNIVNRREWLWNPTTFFVVGFCSLFWPWPCTNTIVVYSVLRN